MSGYFSGYINKTQKVEQYDLKRSMDKHPVLQQKLEARTLNANAQFSNVCNRMFSVLENKGILRTATEVILLAAKYNSGYEL